MGVNPSLVLADAGTHPHPRPHPSLVGATLVVAPYMLCGQPLVVEVREPPAFSPLLSSRMRGPIPPPPALSPKCRSERSEAESRNLVAVERPPPPSFQPPSCPRACGDPSPPRPLTQMSFRAQRSRVEESRCRRTPTSPLFPPPTLLSSRMRGPIFPYL